VLLIRKSIDNLHKVRLEAIPALRHRVSSQLDGVLIKGVIEERVKEASQPNICERKRIYTLAKEEEDGI
jgi:hypothetical protein